MSTIIIILTNSNKHLDAGRINVACFFLTCISEWCISELLIFFIFSSFSIYNGLYCMDIRDLFFCVRTDAGY